MSINVRKHTHTTILIVIKYTNKNSYKIKGDKTYYK